MNSLKKRLSKGEHAHGLIMAADSPIVARALAVTDLDFLIIDQQHGMTDDKALDHMLTAVMSADCTSVVRVANNDPGLIMRAVDLGAFGVVCPLINTGEEATRFVHALRYPPEGGRSWGPLKPSLYFGSDYTERANTEILSIAQIETKEAVDNMEEILSTKGLDAILVGPNDLGFTYGNQPMSMPEDPDVQAAMKKIATACRAKNIYAGIHCGDAKMAKEMFKWGYQFASIGTDIGYLQGFAGQIIDEMTS